MKLNLRIKPYDSFGFFHVRWKILEKVCETRGTVKFNFYFVFNCLLIYPKRSTNLYVKDANGQWDSHVINDTNV